MKEQIIDFYLRYRESKLTHATLAELNNMTDEQLSAIINLGYELYTGKYS